MGSNGIVRVKVDAPLSLPDLRAPMLLCSDFGLF